MLNNCNCKWLWHQVPSCRKLLLDLCDTFSKKGKKFFFLSIPTEKAFKDNGIEQHLPPGPLLRFCLSSAKTSPCTARKTKIQYIDRLIALRIAAVFVLSAIGFSLEMKGRSLLSLSKILEKLFQFHFWISIYAAKCSLKNSLQMRPMGKLSVSRMWEVSLSQQLQWLKCFQALQQILLYPRQQQQLQL